MLADQLTTIVDQLLIPSKATRRLLVLQVGPEESIRTALHRHLSLEHSHARLLVVRLKTGRGNGYQLLGKALMHALGERPQGKTEPLTTAMERARAALAEKCDLLIIDHAEHLDYAGLYFLRPDSLKIPTILIGRSNALIRTIQQHRNIARWCSLHSGM